MIKKLKSELLFFYKLLKKHYILFLSLIGFFILGIVLAYFLDAELRAELLAGAMAKMEEIATDNKWLLFIRIFFNNTLVLIIGILSSIVFIGPFLIELLNGLVLGILVQEVFPKIGTSLSLIALVPHGILELPAFFLASFLGILFWWKIFLPKSVSPELSRKEFSLKLLYLFLFLIILLLIAALIESFLTPFLINLFSPGKII
jgi:stage II sporulation protein M